MGILRLGSGSLASLALAACVSLTVSGDEGLSPGRRTNRQGGILCGHAAKMWTVSRLGPLARPIQGADRQAGATNR